ncbi:hypothetical protein ASD8599_01332 [Ascidiaceihabitans donghaensis]|uniref:DUF4238 domain-containing protein n=1 Tax=Ascidiaceihabitans donghaensis TaxID=1510460 RepID=A0A2R8BC17_9RHOB|nr:DUF4238 domain-containing protein [Ascidiaceihabitans donghaensis]SPH20595.1 hypothetical protein ASD8599_01332 [Ascidiaceihabitans donghaensis]
MSQTSKWHHYVPQGVLSQFCYEGTKFYYFSKRRPEEGVASRDISKKFRKRHYYSVTTLNGQRSDVLEREFLQVLDSKFAEFINQFVQVIYTGKEPVIDLETRKFLQQFFYYYAKRNPDFASNNDIYDQPDLAIRNAIERYQREFGEIAPCKIDEMLDPEKVSEIVQYAHVQSLARSSPMINERLNRMSLHFASAPLGKQFLVGSNPVVRLENMKGALLGDGYVELWTAMTPKLLIGFAGPNSGFPFHLQIDASEVRKINLQLFRQSTEVAGSNKALVNSIVFSR